MKVKILINDSERVEFNKFKTENAILKRQVQALQLTVDELTDIINNNSVDSSGTNATFRTSGSRKDARRKNIGRRRLLKSRKEKQTSHRNRLHRSESEKPSSDERSTSSASYEPSEISSIHTGSDAFDSSINIRNPLDSENIPSIGCFSSDLFSDSGSSLYFTPRGTTSPNESASEELSFYDANSHQFGYDGDEEMTGVGVENVPALRQNVSNGNFGADIPANVHDDERSIPEFMDFSYEASITAQNSPDSFHDCDEIMRDMRSFNQSAVSNFQESYQSFAENCDSLKYPSIFSSDTSTPCFRSISNRSEFVCSTIPNSPASQAEISNLNDGSVLQKRHSNRSLSPSLTTRNVFQHETSPAADSVTSHADVLYATGEDQASNDNAESRFSRRGSPISSSFNESIHGESSLYQSGVSHLRDESLTEAHGSKRNASVSSSGGMNTPVFRSFSDGTISVCSTGPNTQVGSSHLLNGDEPAAKMRRLSQVSPKISHGKRISSTSRVTRPRTYSRVSQAEHVMNEDQIIGRNVGSAENGPHFPGAGSPIIDDILDVAEEWSTSPSSSDECVASSKENVFNTSFMRAAFGYFAQANESEFSIPEHLPAELQSQVPVSCCCCLCKLRESTGDNFPFCVKNHPNLLRCKKFESETLTICNPCMSSMTKNSEKTQNGMYCCSFESCSETFKTLKKLEAHYFEHFHLPKFRCVFCEKGYKTKSPIKRHERNHTEKNVSAQNETHE